MKVVGNFNKISEKLKAEIPVLKPGETKTFQLLHGVPNPDPDPQEKIKNPVLYGKRQLSTNFRIFDPYITDSAGKETGGYVDIGAIKILNPEQPAQSEFVFFVPNKGLFQNTGKFSLIGGKVADVELFETLWLSPQRKGNPHRDKTIQPMFELIDIGEATKATLTKVDILRKALNLVENIKEEPARVLMAALNQKKFTDFVVLKGALSELAKNNPDRVLAAYDDPEKENKAILSEAIDQLILEYNPASRKVMMDKGELTSIPPDEDVLTVLNAWMKTADNGEQVFGLIKNKLRKTSKKEAVPA